MKIWMGCAMCVLAMSTVSGESQTKATPAPQSVTVGAPALLVAAPDVASFHFKRAALALPEWSLEVLADGSGRYDEGVVSTTQSRQPVHVGPKTLARLMGAEKAVASQHCDDGKRDVPESSEKRLAYRMKNSDVWSSCSFVDTDNAALKDAVQAFFALQQTMRFGELLAQYQKTDLGQLDEVVLMLWQMGQEETAIELGNILPLLQEIAANEKNPARARVMSRDLIAMAQAGK